MANQVANLAGDSHCWLVQQCEPCNGLPSHFWLNTNSIPLFSVARKVGVAGESYVKLFPELGGKLYWQFTLLNKPAVEPNACDFKCQKNQRRKQNMPKMPGRSLQLWPNNVLMQTS